MEKCLIVVDFQNDFVDGSLGFENANDIENHICNLIEEYKSNGNDVIFTKDTHPENYMDLQEGKNLPIPHCIKGTPGHELYGRVKELSEGCEIFEKPTFPSLELGNYLATKNYDEVTLVGLVSNICVISNAIIAKAALPEAKIIVDKKGTDSFDKETQEKSFQVMAKGLQIEVL